MFMKFFKFSFEKYVLNSTGIFPSFVSIKASKRDLLLNIRFLLSIPIISSNTQFNNCFSPLCDSLTFLSIKYLIKIILPSKAFANSLLIP